MNTTTPLRALIIEDAEDDVLLVQRALVQGGFDLVFEHVETAPAMQAALERQTWDVVLSDYHLPGFGAAQALALLHGSGQDIPFIIVSGTIGEETAVEMMRAGAVDYVMKGRLRRLVPAVRREMQEAVVRRERQRAEIALRESEMRLRLALKSNNLGVWRSDIVTGEFLDISEIGKANFGLPPEADFSQAEFYQSLHPEDTVRVQEALHRTLTTGQAYQVDYRLMWPDSSIHWISANGTPVYNETGEAIYLIGITKDITESKQARETLEHLRRQQELILNSISEGIHGIDMYGRIIFENPISAKMLGWEVQELLGKQAHSVTHHTKPDGAPYPPNECPISGTLKDAASRLVNDEVFWRKDGTSFPVEYTSNPIHNALGGQDGAVITFRDITKRKLAEEELHNERDFTSAVIQTVGNLVVVLDRQKHIVRFNRACERLSGYSVEEVKGKNIMDLVLAPEEAEAAKRVFNDITSGQFPNSYENHWVTRDGSRRLISWSNTALLDREGAVEFVIGTGIDITDERRREAALRESEERFRQMAENINEVFWMTNPEASQMLYINPAYETIWGRTCQSLYDQPASFADPVHPDDRESLFAALQANYLSGGFDTEYRIVRPDGSVRWIWARAFPIRDEQGEVYRVTGIAQDITERKMAAEELESAHIEMLERLARAGEFRDDVTGLHTQRVAYIVALLVRSLGFPEERVRWIQQAARLHDIGKIGISDLILLKPGKLTEEEFAVMQTHTTIGARLFDEGHSELIQMAQRIAVSHHERWDGTGYPQGLRGEDIPIEGRLLAVADVFDALTHDRPYKKAWSVSETVAEIKRQSGRHFDPSVVDSFLRLAHDDLI